MVAVLWFLHLLVPDTPLVARIGDLAKKVEMSFTGDFTRITGCDSLA